MTRRKAVATDNKIYVYLLTPGNQLVRREMNHSPVANTAGLEHMFKAGAAFKAVVVYHVRDLEGDAGGPFLDNFDVIEQLKVGGTADGLTIARRDFTGPNKGTTERTYFSNGSPPLQATGIEAAFEDGVMAGGANWRVLDDGSGSVYDQRLVEARQDFGLNDDGTIPNGWTPP